MRRRLPSKDGVDLDTGGASAQAEGSSTAGGLQNKASMGAAPKAKTQSGKKGAKKRGKKAQGPTAGSMYGVSHRPTKQSFHGSLSEVCLPFGAHGVSAKVNTFYHYHDFSLMSNLIGYVPGCISGIRLVISCAGTSSRPWCNTSGATCSCETCSACVQRLQALRSHFY